MNGWIGEWNKGNGKRWMVQMLLLNHCLWRWSLTHTLLLRAVLFMISLRVWIFTSSITLMAIGRDAWRVPQFKTRQNIEPNYQLTVQIFQSQNAHCISWVVWSPLSIHHPFPASTANMKNNGFFRTCTKLWIISREALGELKCPRERLQTFSWVSFAITFVKTPDNVRM